MKNQKFSRFFFLFFFLFSPHLLSQDIATSAFPPAPKEISPIVKTQIVAENQTITVLGEKIVYDVHEGLISINNQGKKESADMHFMAYFSKLHSRDSKRPIAFCFNGGPGSSSVWLHIGFLGPKIVTLPESYNQVTTPLCKPNPYSLLAVCDLVFIDPVSTGFSTASNEKSFLSVMPDLYATADFVQLFLTKYQRWHSPKLLIGESYGAARAVGLAHLLQTEYLLNIDGLILISFVLDFQTIKSSSSFDLGNVLFLPSFAAVAQYHKKLSPPYAEISLKELSERVCTFAQNDYAPALIAGTKASEKMQKSIATTLSEFTSLPQSFFLSHNLRLNQKEFSNLLLSSNSLIIGRLDGRISSWMLPKERSVCDSFPWLLDPSFSFIASTFSCAMHDYLEKDLKLAHEKPYLIFNQSANHFWEWDTDSIEPGLEVTSFVQDLRASFAKNPNLKLFAATGYYDLATPFFAQEYTLNHLFLPESHRKNVTLKCYEAGHMIYLDKKPREELFSDISRFIKTQVEK